MAVEDVARALMAMDDADMRRRLAAGDFGTFDLTTQEQALVSAATPVLPDGHPDKVFVHAGDVAAHAKRDDGDSGFWPAGTAAAITYVNEQLADPRLQAQFSGWKRAARDNFP